MKIEKAIEMLQEAQKSGTKSIVLAYWEAEMFDRKDDESWEAESEWIENDMDWSRAHDQMCDLLEATID
jgi:hypothetical protein